MASTPEMKVQVDLEMVRDTSYALHRFTEKVSEAFLELAAELDEVRIKHRAESERGLYTEQPCPKCGKRVGFMHDHFDPHTPNPGWTCTPFLEVDPT